ncbi:MAG: thiamine phosphate synthase [Candidatus Brocadiia bacterium]
MLYRIIDVNYNRAREATRVIEDYARFGLDDKPLYQSARGIRHRLVRLMKPLERGLIASRDISADVGKDNPAGSKTNPEIVTSNLKRLQESLRSIIEYLKADLPGLARRVEALRFQAYQLEQSFRFVLHPNLWLANTRLYLLISEKDINKLPGLLRPARTAHADGSGVDMVQLRSKGLMDDKLLSLAKRVRQITRQYRKLFIINDRADLALLSDADGVHLGKDDIAISQARKILGVNRIIGATSHDIKEALSAQRQGADYISVGPFYKTPTKPGLEPNGYGYLGKAVRQLRIPYFLIGGINKGNIGQLKSAHGRKPLRIAVSTGILTAKNPTLAARQLAKQLNNTSARAHHKAEIKFDAARGI